MADNTSKKQKGTGEALRAGILTFKKDLKTILNQMEGKTKDLKNLEGLISAKRLELKSLVDNRDFTVDKIKKSILEIEEAKRVLESDIKGLENKKQNITEEYLTLVENTREYLTTKQSEKLEAESKIRIAEDKLKGINSNIGISQRFLFKLNEEINEKGVIGEEIKKSLDQLSAIRQEIVDLEGKKSEYLAMVDETRRYRETLDQEEKELEKEKIEVEVMRKRLQPQYIKVFKQYGNI